MMQFVVDRSQGNASIEVFNVTYPISNADICKNYAAFLDEIHDPARPIRLASIEHVSSSPSVLNPIECLIGVLKERNIPILVDGSHALGSVPIDIKALAPDYYVTGTKHMYVARGCSVLWVAKKNQATVHPATTSWDYDRPANFQNEFYWIGTHDNTPYMTVPAAIQFRKDIGGEAAIRAYNHGLAVGMGNKLAQSFGTQVLHHPEQIGTMVDVQLPIINVDNPLINTPPPGNHIKIYNWWVEQQVTKYKSTYVSVYKHNGRWWARLIPEIHNELNDYYILEKHLLSIIRNELGEPGHFSNSTLPTTD